MLQIRNGVFETNSSSTHSITVCSQNTYDKWADGELYFNTGWFSSPEDLAEKEFVTKEEAITLLVNNEYWNSEYEYTREQLGSKDDEELESIFGEEGICTMNYFFDSYSRYLETYEEYYTTESGDDIVVFGNYGHD